MSRSIKGLIFIFLILLSGNALGQNLITQAECATFDSLYNRYLVSCWAAGCIVAVDESGNQSYFKQGLSQAHGHCISNGAIYVSVPGGVRGYDLATANLVLSVSIPGSSQLDGIAADTSGYLYVLDYVVNQSAPDRIFRIRISDQTYTPFVIAGLAWSPQDVVFDATLNRLLVVGYSDVAPIQAVSLPGGAISTVVEMTPGYLDGIAQDNHGNTYVSSFGLNTVYRYDSDFSEPPTVAADGFVGNSNISYNTRDEILVIPSYTEGKLYLRDMKAIFTADTSHGFVPFVVNFQGWSALADITGWKWYFGDGDSSMIQSPAHSYLQPGIFDVTLQVAANDNVYSLTKEALITALADSIKAPDTYGDPGATVEVVISARNTVPLKQLLVPVEYSGTLFLTLDSFSTVGCRTDQMDNKSKFDSAPSSRRACFDLSNNYQSSTPPLEPGDGPVLKLYFKLSSSAAFGQTASIVLDGYTTFLPKFSGLLFDYAPTPKQGQVGLSFICGDINNDGKVNIMDVGFMINYLYRGGPAPNPAEIADVDASGNLNIMDVTYFINYLYKAGPLPNCQ